MRGSLRQRFDAASATWSPVVELRQYSVHPGQRDALIDLFDREFVESQENLDIRVIGQFRDMDDPDRFVWLRGFPDMATRGRSLPSFYDGPVWLEHRHAANATMVDSDNVLLLRPARPNAGFTPVRADRLPRGTTGERGGVVIASVVSLETSEQEVSIDTFERELEPKLRAAGGTVLAYFVTEHSPNNFRLPVRESENVFAWFAGFADGKLDASVLPVVSSFGTSVHVRGGLQPPQVLRLAPTARSLLSGSSPACTALSAISGSSDPTSLGRRAV
jgi:hypothetical protein